MRTYNHFVGTYNTCYDRHGKLVTPGCTIRWIDNGETEPIFAIEDSTGYAEIGIGINATNTHFMGKEWEPAEFYPLTGAKRRDMEVMEPGLPVYQYVEYDAWGNADDGWEINDRFPFPMYWIVSDDAEEKEILAAMVRNHFPADMEIDSSMTDDMAIVFCDKQGKPRCALERVIEYA